MKYLGLILSLLCILSCADETNSRDLIPILPHKPDRNVGDYLIDFTRPKKEACTPLLGQKWELKQIINATADLSSWETFDQAPGRFVYFQDFGVVYFNGDFEETETESGIVQTPRVFTQKWVPSNQPWTRSLFGSEFEHLYDIEDFTNGVGVFRSLATQDSILFDFYNDKQCYLYLKAAE